jgi:hypothetical protein
VGLNARLLFATLAVVGLAHAAGDAGAAPGAAAGDEALPATIDGLDHAEWTARWWQWAYGFAPGMEPFRDPDGRLCSVRQRGPVWFLAGTDGSFDARRSCRIPEGRYLLVPVINMVSFGAISGPNAFPCRRLRASAAVNNDHLRSAVVVLDGKPLEASRIRRLGTRDCFDPRPEADDGGSGMRAAADGYWLLLPPLSPGRHVLSIGANYDAPGDTTYGDMVQNFEYTLDVGEPTI